MKQQITKAFRDAGIKVRIRVFNTTSHTMYRVCTCDGSPHTKLSQEIVAGLGLTTALKTKPGGNINQQHEMFTYEYKR